MNSDAAFLLLYDITLERPPNLGWLAVSAAVLVVGLAAWRRRRRQGKLLGVARFFTLAFGLMLAVTGLSVWDHHRLQSVLRGGEARVVQGLLQSHDVQHRAHWNSRSRSYDRSIAESFYVGDVPFGFVRDGSAAGWTNSGDEPIEFAPGQQLRVHYVEDAPDDFASRRIVRLERLMPPSSAMAAALATHLGATDDASKGR